MENKIQPITLVQVPGCRVPTADASRRTIERRTEVLSTVRQIASSGDSSTQFAAEIKSLRQKEKTSLSKHTSPSLSLLIMPLPSRLTLESLGIN